jgi:hypothetical protein
MGAAIVAFVVCELGALVAGLQVVNSPLIYGAWPAGVTRSTLAQAARSGLEACASAPDQAPGGCPQSTALAPPVRWALVGDPALTAAMDMVGRSRAGFQFQVWGDYAMIARSGALARASEGPFIALVTSDGRGLHVTSVVRGGFAAARPVAATDLVARDAAWHALEDCPAGVRVCAPANGLAFTLPPPAWSSVSYDASTGVIHVRGRLGGARPSRSFDAHEVPAAGGLTCYLIDFS